MSVFGTRPEAIKMCPLVKELENTEGIESVVCLTGQHREMLQQVIDIFGTKVKYNLDIMKPRQTLTTITSSILEKIEPVLIEEKPDINNAEYVSNVNGNEQQQSHDRNKKGESSLLFLIIFMVIVLIASSIK